MSDCAFPTDEDYQSLLDSEQANMTLEEQILDRYNDNEYQFTAEDLRDSPHLTGIWNKLRELLLKQGGENVILLHGRYEEPFVKEILEYGKLYSSDGLVLLNGAWGECYDNSKRRALADPTVRYIRGWASFDGVWEGHAWNLNANSQIEETTDLVREIYFGVDATGVLK